MSMSKKALFQPLKIRNTIFKNRIEATTSEPHYLNGPEKYPEFLPMTQFPDYDVFDLRNANQFIRLTDTIHFYQSIACATLDFIYGGREFDINQYHFSIPKVDHFDDLSEDEAHNIEKFLIKQAMACKKVGFDMVSIHCAYGRTLMA